MVSGARSRPKWHGGVDTVAMQLGVTSGADTIQHSVEVVLPLTAPVTRYSVSLLSPIDMITLHTRDDGTRRMYDECSPNVRRMFDECTTNVHRMFDNYTLCVVELFYGLLYE